MNRRKLLVRTLTSAVNAAIFTATGWLMGSRTLTMATAPLPGCNGSGCNPATCKEKCYSYPPTCVGFDCINACRTSTINQYGCDGWGCACYCKETVSFGPCGGCNYPCMN